MARRHSIPTPDSPPGGVTRYRDRIFDDLRHDPYQAKGKYREPTACAGCGAIFENGRWKWGEAPPQAHKATCPACARTRDKLPAGFVTLSGEFFNAHRAELLQLARNTAERIGLGRDLDEVEVDLQLETRGRDHGEHVIESLQAASYVVSPG